MNINPTLSVLINASYGFNPAESRHHFVADIPRVGDAAIKISRHHTWDDETNSSAVTTEVAGWAEGHNPQCTAFITCPAK
jgi:hypothetical protein